jgi:hypothetical protein
MAGAMSDHGSYSALPFGQYFCPISQDNARLVDHSQEYLAPVETPLLIYEAIHKNMIILEGHHSVSCN